jgi:voltage-gated potassium channel Kch
MVADFECPASPSSCTNWITFYGLEYRNNQHVYIHALHWAAATITTTGFSDVVAQTDGEQIVSIICMMGGLAVMAFSIIHLAEVAHSSRSAATR